MNLHNDKENFIMSINLASKFFNMSPAIIEKDYYVTMFLQELNRKIPEIIFKGGTSLSKCFKIIDRFSEDIDITLDANYQSQGNKRKLKETIIEICEELNLNLTNKEEIRSRRDYNCYKIDYPSNNNVLGLNPKLLVETVFIVKSFPDEIKQASSMIYDYLLSIGNIDAINQYELQPFDIRVQTLERTLIDKIFALCDYMIDDKVERHSRHIYDIYCLLPYIKLDISFKELIEDVRIDRKQGKKSYSAQDNISVTSILEEIINTKYYKKDYEEITEKLLSYNVSYEEAIKSIITIKDSKIFG